MGFSMFEMRTKVILIYLVTVLVIYLLKRVVTNMAHKAINNKKLTTGIYRLFPVEGEQAVKLARSYVLAVKIFFWFIVILFPFMFFVSIKLGDL